MTGAAMRQEARMHERLTAPVAPVESALDRLEVRCPQCHSLLATYVMDDDAPAILMVARCRRCRCMYEARLQPTGSTATLAATGRVPESR